MRNQVGRQVRREEESPYLINIVLLLLKPISREHCHLSSPGSSLYKPNMAGILSSSQSFATLNSSVAQKTFLDIIVTQQCHEEPFKCAFSHACLYHEISEDRILIIDRGDCLMNYISVRIALPTTGKLEIRSMNRSIFLHL